LFGELADGLKMNLIEEGQSFEKNFIGLAEDLRLVALGQSLDQLLFLGDVESGLYLDRLIDIVEDLLLEVLRKI
jgi:hypothetical protein